MKTVDSTDAGHLKLSTSSTHTIGCYSMHKATTVPSAIRARPLGESFHSDNGKAPSAAQKPVF